MWCITPVSLSFSLADCIQRAAGQCSLKLESIAWAMGEMSKVQFSRAIHGRDRFPWDRLLMAVERDPDVAQFYDVLLDHLAVAMGREHLSPEALMRRALLLMDRRQMAKASLAPAVEERKRA